MPIGTSTPPGAPPGPEAAAREDELWRALTTRLAVFVRRRIGDPYAAEDVAQEVLLRLHRNLGELRAHDRLDAFAYRIARNAIIDHYRAAATAKELVSAPDDLIARIDAEGGIGAELDAVAALTSSCVAWSRPSAGSQSAIARP
jgi:RNA polymerase sigma factor (sigma-70 family)